MISNKNIILFCFFLVASIGCAKVPCYPPDYYAPEPSAPYPAEEVRIPTLRGYILAGTLTLPSFEKPPYPAVYALVIMAGSATNGIKIREYQNRLKIDERSNLTGMEKERELSKSMKGLRQALSRAEGSPWVRSFFYYMPLPAAKKVSCPVLILHGDKDANVPVDHAHHLANAMRFSGNTDVTVKIFTNHNHLFLEDPVGNISG